MIDNEHKEPEHRFDFEETSRESSHLEGSNILNEDGSFNIKREGSIYKNLYTSLIEISWSKFLLFFLLLYIAVNCIFAGMYMLVGVEHLNGIDPNDDMHPFFHAFFFSIQTFTTVGYGEINPTGFAANLVSTFDAFIGLLIFALATGVFFVRFSKPRAHILFSNNMVITPFKGMNSLQFRIVNSNDSQIIDLEARITATWIEKKEDGSMRRKFEKLDLVIESIHLFPVNWTVMHLINEQSPLFGRSVERLRQHNMEFLVLIKGYEETYSNMVHKSRSYKCKDIISNAVFESMYEIREEDTIVHLNQINKIAPLD